MASIKENNNCVEVKRLQKLYSCNNIQQIKETLNEFMQNVPFLDERIKELYGKIIDLIKESEELKSEQNLLIMKKNTLHTKQVHLQEKTKIITNEIDFYEKSNAELTKNKEMEIAELLKVLHNLGDTILEGVGKKLEDSRKLYDIDYLENLVKEHEERILNSEQEIRKLEDEHAAMLEEFQNLKAEIPENLEAIAGKNELKNKVQKAIITSEKLQRKHDELVAESKDL